MKLYKLLTVVAIACGISWPAVAQMGSQSGAAGQPGMTQPAGDTSSSDKSTAKSSSMSNIDRRSALQVKNGQTRKQTFDAIDRNRDGYISHDEAGAIPALLVMFAQADRNSDNRLSAAEFAPVPIVQANGSSVQ